MQNINFLQSINENLFIVGGSYAIRSEFPGFRMNNDYDIEIKGKDWDYFEFTLGKWGASIDKSKYGNECIYVVNFDDGSSIDIIVRKDFPSKEEIKKGTQGFYIRKIPFVIDCKIDLINNHTDNENISNKHVKDILWLLNNTPYKIKL